MAQENYVEGCSMKRSPLLKANGFFFWKILFETYIKSKDIDLWQVIQNGNVYFKIEYSKTKMMMETPYELLKDNKKNPDYSSKNHVRKFLRALSLKWRAKMTTIKEAKDLATFPLDELIGNLKVYEMILASDGVASKPIKEKLMSIYLKANLTRGQTSNDSDNRFERENHFGNGGDRFDRGHGNKSKGVGSSIGKRNCYGCGSKNHFIDDSPKARCKRHLLVKLEVIAKMVIKWRRTQHVSWRSLCKL
uniref:UBN2 domain-containing protein n=1 Tax=Tanacetum cinerariifolium TaxID=118510 RepID=A0A699GMU9_TANCI|nr:hypothetical protein [Tanacetum cinerariifolium]